MTGMMYDRAREILALPASAGVDAVRARYAELHGEYQVRLTNAPTASLKATYQRQLEELRAAAETLAPELVATGSVDLPSMTPVIDVEKEPHRRDDVPRQGVVTGRPPARRTSLKTVTGTLVVLVIVLGTYAIVQITTRPARDAPPSSTSAVSSSSGPANGTLLFDTDVPARLYVDGQEIGVASPGSPFRWEVKDGKEHLVGAVPRSGVGEWKETVEIPAGGQKVVIVRLQNQNSERSQSANESSTRLGNAPAGMVLVPAGCFTMGDSEEPDAPPHRVCVNAFYMDKTVVTNREFRRFKRTTSYVRTQDREMGIDFEIRDNEEPAIMLSWDDAAAYANWVGKRLPTEAEFEYAARGGLAHAKFPRGDHDPVEGVDFRWQGEPRAKPNGYGLFDMTGYVDQWCADWYSENYVGCSSSNPRGPSNGTERVFRGGNNFGCAPRKHAEPSYYDDDTGIRCVKDVVAQ